MANQKPSPVDYGFGGHVGWVVSGIISGIAGSMAFGAILGLFYPNVISVTIPSLYGLEPGGSLGFWLHLLHGLILGVIYAFVVTRELVLRILVLNINSASNLGPNTRLILAGAIYGLAVWIAIPLLALPVWTSITGSTDPAFPTATVGSLAGHFIFGVTLGFLFSFLVRIPEKFGG